MPLTSWIGLLGSCYAVEGVGILIARLFSLGMLVGLSSVLTLGTAVFAPADAAHPAWSGYASQTKRPLFRPWSRYPRRSAALRWRPQPQPMTSARSAASAVAAGVPGVSTEPLFGRSPGAGAAWPMRTQAKQDWRFRPDQRGSAQVADRSGHGRADMRASRLHAQFRPPRIKRQRSYEEIQSEGGYAHPPGGMVYGMLAGAGAQGYRPHWPRW